MLLFYNLSDVIIFQISWALHKMIFIHKKQEHHMAEHAMIFDLAT